MPPWRMLAPVVRLPYLDSTAETGISVMGANVFMITRLV